MADEEWSELLRREGVRPEALDELVAWARGRARDLTRELRRGVKPGPPKRPAQPVAVAAEEVVGSGEEGFPEDAFLDDAFDLLSRDEAGPSARSEEVELLEGEAVELVEDEPRTGRASG